MVGDDLNYLRSFCRFICRNRGAVGLLPFLTLASTLAEAAGLEGRHRWGLIPDPPLKRRRWLAKASSSRPAPKKRPLQTPEPKQRPPGNFSEIS